MLPICKLSLLPLLLLSFISCNAQKNDWKSREIKNDTDLLKTTTWLRLISSAGDVRVLGTGYFYYSNSRKQLYIITNRHIVANFSVLQFGFNLVSRSINYAMIDKLQERIIYFKNQSTDLAAIRIDNAPGFDFNNLPYFKVFNETNLISSSDMSKLDIFNEKLISLSFPKITRLPLPSQPYIFHCSFAIPYNFVDGEFCINGDLIDGCSGSPIVSIRKEKGKTKYNLLGTFYMAHAAYESIDSVHRVYFDSVTYRLPIQVNSAVEINNSKKLLEGYMVNLPIYLGWAVKSEKLAELLNQ